MAFVVDPQLPMPAAWGNNDGGACRLVFRRQVGGERWLVNIRDNVFPVWRNAHGFRAGFAFRTGRPLRPEQYFFGLLSERRREQKAAKRAAQGEIFFHVEGISSESSPPRNYRRQSINKRYGAPAQLSFGPKPFENA
jgi:hypothetical protein